MRDQICYLEEKHNRDESTCKGPETGVWDIPSLIRIVRRPVGDIKGRGKVTRGSVGLREDHVSDPPEGYKQRSSLICPSRAARLEGGRESR